jgi:hypothetical protein
VNPNNFPRKNDAENVLNGIGITMARFTVRSRIVPPKVSVPSSINESFNKKQASNISMISVRHGFKVFVYCELSKVQATMLIKDTVSRILVRNTKLYGMSHISVLGAHSGQEK